VDSKQPEPDSLEFLAAVQQPLEAALVSKELVMMPEGLWSLFGEQPVRFEALRAHRALLGQFQAVVTVLSVSQLVEVAVMVLLVAVVVVVVVALVLVSGLGLGSGSGLDLEQLLVELDALILLVLVLMALVLVALVALVIALALVRH
jgi:hypothetical protein